MKTLIKYLKDFIVLLLFIIITLNSNAQCSNDEPSDPPINALHTIVVSTQSEFSAAVSNAQPGDHIVLRNGTYTGLTITKSGTAANPIVIEAANKHMAIIKGLIQDNGSYTWIHALKFIDLKSGVDINASHVTITRNLFTGGRGVSVSVGDLYIKIGYNKFATMVAEVPSPDLSADSDIYIDVSRSQTTMPDHGRIYRNYFTNVSDDGTAETHFIYIGPDAGLPDMISFTDFIIEYNLIENGKRDRGIYAKRGCTIRYNQINTCSACNFGFRSGKEGQLYGNRINNIRSFIVNGPDQDVRGNVVVGADIEVNAETGATSNVYHPAADNALLVGNTGSVIVGATLSPLVRAVKNVRICSHTGTVTIQDAVGTQQPKSCVETSPKTITLTPSQVGPDVVCGITTSVEENDSEEKIVVYPNPSTGIFTIKYTGEDKNVKLNVYDITGRMIGSAEYKNSGTGLTEQVDLYEFPNGIYIIQLQTENEFKTMKLVKQN